MSNQRRLGQGPGAGCCGKLCLRCGCCETGGQSDAHPELARGGAGSDHLPPLWSSNAAQNELLLPPAFSILIFKKKTMHVYAYFTSICCLATSVRDR